MKEETKLCPGSRGCPGLRLSRLRRTYSGGSGFCREVLPASVVFMGLKSQIVTLNNSFLVLGASDLILESKEVTGHAWSRAPDPSRSSSPSLGAADQGPGQFFSFRGAG